jgi:hypothetical protein
LTVSSAREIPDVEAELDAKLTLEKQWSRRILERLDMFRKFKNSNEFEKYGSSLLMGRG